MNIILNVVFVVVVTKNTQELNGVNLLKEVDTEEVTVRWQGTGSLRLVHL